MEGDGGLRTKIYESRRMRNGRRFVRSGTPMEWFVYEIILWMLKAAFFCMFFWVIIPVRLFRKR